MLTVTDLFAGAGGSSTGAVTPPNARDLIWAVVQSLGGEARAA